MLVANVAHRYFALYAALTAPACSYIASSTSTCKSNTRKLSSTIIPQTHEHSSDAAVVTSTMLCKGCLPTVRTHNCRHSCWSLAVGCARATHIRSAQVSGKRTATTAGSMSGTAAAASARASARSSRHLSRVVSPHFATVSGAPEARCPLDPALGCDSRLFWDSRPGVLPARCSAELSASRKGRAQQLG